MTAEIRGIIFERPGHATVRIETEAGTVIYIDPWSEVVDGAPGDADVVFVSHAHRDHYDPDAIGAVSSESTEVAVYEAVDTSALEYDVTALPYDGEVLVDGVEVRTVPAYNRSDGSHVRENGEPYHREREVIGLVLTVDGTTIYYASDTDFLDEHREIDADVLIPPIGGRPTMNRHEAAEMAGSIGPELVLPVHYDTEGIEGIGTDAEAFEGEVEAMGIQVVLF